MSTNTNTERAVTVRPPDDDLDALSITGIARVAGTIAASKMFPACDTPEKAFVVIMAGQELGITPFAALAGIHIVKGKPIIGAGLLGALVKAHPSYDYLVTEQSDQACRIVFFRDGIEIGDSTFTIQQAQKAGLAGKDVWKAWPANMLFARALSNGVKWHCPDVTGGRADLEQHEESEPAPPVVVPYASAATATSALYRTPPPADDEPDAGVRATPEPDQPTPGSAAEETVVDVDVEPATEPSLGPGEVVVTWGQWQGHTVAQCATDERWRAWIVQTEFSDDQAEQRRVQQAARAYLADTTTAGAAA